jgi:thiol-disulfide isomerase/thioredoxin
MPGRLGSLYLLLCLVAIWSVPLTSYAQRSLDIKSADGSEIPVEVYGNAAGVRLIWLPAETGLQAADRVQARALAALGVEVWLADLFAARFLPLGQSSLDGIPAEDVTALIGAAGRDGAEVYLLAPGRGAIPLLRGVRLWQQQEGRSIAGVILLHPKLYVETPDPGEAARFVPVVTASNQAIYLFQPELSPWRWRLTEIVPALQTGGSDVFIQRLPAVRDRFYFRPDATAAEGEMARRLPRQLWLAMGRLQYIRHPRAAAPLLQSPAPVTTGRKAHALKPYAGDPQPAPLALPDLGGKRRQLRELQGRVVLVNFWASWCPPCVHEMPSMQGLYARYHPAGLEILAVNMAEDAATIQRFLRERVQVKFPVLQDSEGEALRAWGVFAFPTSYLIDRQGRIRYALFGAVDWQDAEIVRVVETMLQQS